MKWQNIDAGQGYYYITGTVTEWLPLLSRDDIRRAVVDEIKVALTRYKATIAAYVIMPDHLHLLVWLPSDAVLHRFLKCWRGRAAKRMIDLLARQQDTEVLRVLSRHANGGCTFAAWKEQPRSLPIYRWPKVDEKMAYTHANPVRRGLVETPDQWRFSSYRFYESGEPGLLPVVPPEP